MQEKVQKNFHSHPTDWAKCCPALDLPEVRVFSGNGDCDLFWSQSEFIWLEGRMLTHGITLWAAQIPVTTLHAATRLP